MNERTMKAEFVREYGELLKKYTGDRTHIESLEYSENEYHDEIVTVTFRNGYQKQINVTADSIMAITYDIYRYIV